MKRYVMKSGGSILTFDAETKRWSYSTEGGALEDMDVRIEVEGELLSCFGAAISAMESMETDGNQGACAQLSITSKVHLQALKAEVVFRLYHEGPFLTISVVLYNESASAVRLDTCKLLSSHSGSKVTLGDHAGIRMLCQSAWVVDNSVKVMGGEPGIQRSRTIGLLYHPEKEAAINCSFLTFDRADTKTVYTDKDGRLALEVSCDFAGYELIPNGSTKSETAYFELADDPFASLERWASRVAKHYQPQFASRPSIGWVGGWTWRDGFSQDTYEEIVLENVAAIRQKLGGFEIRNIWASIANIKDMLPGLWMEENRDAFPHGISWLVEKLERNDMRLGFWIAPFWIPDRLCNLFEEQRENLLKQGEEYVWCNYQLPYGKSGKLPKGERVGFYSLDGSHPNTRCLLERVFKNYRKLGIRYFMIDFLYAGSGNTPGQFPYDTYWDRTKIKGPEVYREALKVIREAAGADTYLISSTGTTFQNIGCVDAVRVGPDIGEGRPLIETMGTYPATYTVGNWALIRTVAASMACTYFTDRQFYYNDAFNVLTVDKPIPLEEARATVTMFALSSGPVMLGDDIATITNERLALIKKCLPQYNRMARPVDLFTSVYPDSPKVFNLHVEKSWDEWNVVCVLNTGPLPLGQRLDFRELGLKPEVAYTAFDFWNEAYLGEARDALEINVPAFSVKVLRLGKTRPHPWLLSSDMHVTQGAVEIEQLEWDATQQILRGVCVRPAGESGNLYFLLPKGWKPVNYTGMNVAKACTDGMVIAVKRIDFKVETVTWRIDMEKFGQADELNYAGL